MGGASVYCVLLVTITLPITGNKMQVPTAKKKKTYVCISLEEVALSEI
jgi:hypothetical protein